jgi:hypothetical protein
VVGPTIQESALSGENEMHMSADGDADLSDLWTSRTGYLLEISSILIHGKEMFNIQWFQPN